MDGAVTYLPIAALSVSIFALFISWRSYRLSKLAALHRRPYLIGKSFANGSVISLEGPESDHWAIASVRLIWPPNAVFERNEMEFDDGGSIARSWMVPVGRSLKGEGHALLVSTSGSDALVLVSASSKTRPKMSQRWVIRIRMKD